MAAGVRLVISRLVLIFALPLDFHGRVRVVRSLCLPAALHGIEASFLASDRLRKLWPSVHKVVWSRRQLSADVGAVLSLLDGPTRCDPLFCVVWFRFRLLRRYLALWPAEVARVHSLLEMVGGSCPGHGPIHLLSASAAEIGFRWNPDALAWVRPGLPMLGNLAGPLQHFRAAILDAWRNKVAADLCRRKGFRGGPLLDIHGSLQLLNSSHVHTRSVGCARGEHVLHGARTNSCLVTHAARVNSFGLHSARGYSGEHIDSYRCTYNSCGGVRGGTKPMSISTRCQVGCLAAEKLASPQQAPGKLHDETWAGILQKQGLRNSQEVEIVPGCAAVVARPSCPDHSPEPLGPGTVIRTMLVWSQLEKTAGSGAWLFRGALQGKNLFSSLAATGDWVRKGSYHTAWAVPL